MWLREERTAAAAWRRGQRGRAAVTRAREKTTPRFGTATASQARESEMVWGPGKWGVGAWGPAVYQARAVHWAGVWGSGRWRYMFWGRRRVRVR